MSQISVSAVLRPAAPSGSRATAVTSGVLAGWLALILLIGAAGAFVRPPGVLPLPIVIGVVVPLVLFGAALRASAGFRRFLSSLDLGLLTAVQAWRFAGLGFLALYAHGVLPAGFAWPAGIGDLAVGIAAPFVSLAVVRRPGFAATPTFVAWNLLGILDLVVAVGLGALGSLLAKPGEVATSPMATLPLVLIPAYLVPLFVMAHIAALIQSRRMSESAPSMR